MKIGTRSVLFGAHCFLLHPFLIALGWWREFGFARVYVGTRERIRWLDEDEEGWPAIDDLPVYTWLLSPRLWLAFFVHDIGYLGKPNMDGPEGETHPEVGAAIMRFICGEPWGNLVLQHSRYYARRLSRPVSPLAIADKWAIVLEPSWLYLPRVWASRELSEYLGMARARVVFDRQPNDPMTVEEFAAYRSGNPWRWHRAMRTYMRRWIAEHRDGKADSWTRLRHAEVAHG